MTDPPILPLMLKVGWRITRNQVVDALRLEFMIERGATYEITAIHDGCVSVKEVRNADGEPGSDFDLCTIPERMLTTQYFDMD